MESDKDIHETTAASVRPDRLFVVVVVFQLNLLYNKP